MDVTFHVNSRIAPSNSMSNRRKYLPTLVHPSRSFRNG